MALSLEEQSGLEHDSIDESKGHFPSSTRITARNVMRFWRLDTRSSHCNTGTNSPLSKQVTLPEDELPLLVPPQYASLLLECRAALLVAANEALSNGKNMAEIQGVLAEKCASIARQRSRLHKKYTIASAPLDPEAERIVEKIRKQSVQKPEKRGKGTTRTYCQPIDISDASWE